MDDAHRVTDNAILLLGYVASGINRSPPGSTYVLEQTEPADGYLIVRHVQSGKRLCVSVAELEGASS